MRILIFLFLLAACTNPAGADQHDLCIPTIGRDVCGLPAVTVFSRYDQLYGEKISTYAYLYFEEGDYAALSVDVESPQRADHYSCIRVSLAESTYSGALTKDEITPGSYYARVTGVLVDTRSSGICIGRLDSADIYVLSRIRTDEPQARDSSVGNPR